MVKKLYNYLEEKRILIDASKRSMGRLEKNIDESPISGDKDLTVRVKELDPVTIVKDKRYPFAWTSVDESRDYPAINFFRYGNRTQTILMPNNNEFIIESHLPGDESGALRSIKKWYLRQDSSAKKALCHSSLVRIESEGILMPGKSFSGKTSLTLAFLEKLSADLIADEDTLVEKLDSSLVGFYLPRPVHIRLKSVYDVEKLSKILYDLSITEATQNVDEGYIKKLIQTGTFDLDASIDIARRNFAELLGIKTANKCNITRIVFPEYSTDINPRIERINSGEAYRLLKEMELPKNSDMGRLKKAYEIEPVTEHLIDEEWINGITCFRLSFSDYKRLNKSIIGDILL